MQSVTFGVPTTFQTKQQTSPQLDTQCQTVDYQKYSQVLHNVYRFNNTVVNAQQIRLLYEEALKLKQNNILKAMELFHQCEKLIDEKTSDDLKYEIYVNLALFSSDDDKVSFYYTKAIEIYNDRSEPYFYWALYYCRCKQHLKAIHLLHKSLKLNYEQAKLKYPTTQFTAYGEYLYSTYLTCCNSISDEEASSILESIQSDSQLQFCIAMIENRKQKIDI